jgi:hypothetical protein
MLLPALLFCAGLSSCSTSPVPEPAVGHRYPDLELYDQSGSAVHLSDFRGKILLIHAVSMACPICQALSAADRFGPYGTVIPDVRFFSLENYLHRFAPGVHLNDPRIQVLQIIFFDEQQEPPTPAELAAWSAHFDLHRRNIIVLGAPMNLSQTLGRKIVPGFQLLDRNMVLRADSTGRIPQQDFVNQLLPLLQSLARALTR